MEITELSKTLREMGVVGAGGAGFPTYAKLTDKAEFILLNCAECEPLLRLHRQLLAQHAKEILDAFEETRKTVGAKEGIICIKRNYKSAIAAVTDFIQNYPDLKIHILDTVYPAGDEVMLIYEATGKVVRPGGIPIECGVAVFNVETMYNVYYALKNKPVTSKLITVVGEVNNPVTVRVPLGVTLKEVVALAGGEKIKDFIYYVGGPMMGNILSPSSPVVKTTNAIIVLPENHYLVNRKNSDIQIEIHRAASSCCQCQACTDLCPRFNLGHPIEPHKIMRAASSNNFSDTQAFINTFYCCGCGVCEMYACPQGLSPRKIIQLIKSGLRSAGIKPPKDAEAGPVNEYREYRKVPIERLMARLGVSEYKATAPLDNVLKTGYNKVTENLSQHIGIPAKPCVKQGDTVKAGDVIASPADGLSVAIHASIDGIVGEVTDKYIMIIAKDMRI